MLFLCLQHRLDKLLTGLRAQNNQPSGVSLGFESPQDLCLAAFKVGIESKSKTVSISGVNIYANQITLKGGDELTLSSVQIKSYNPSADQEGQTLTASALNNIKHKRNNIYNRRNGGNFNNKHGNIFK